MSELPIAGSYRPTVMGMEGVVASGHYLASLAAQRILDRGGNAIDAGVAAGLCTCVLQIDMVDLAGVAPIIIYLADEDRVVTISSHSRRRRMLLKINDLSYRAFVNIKSIESTTYAFYATSNGQVLN